MAAKKKIFIGIAIAIPLVLVGIFFFISANLNTLVKTAVETVGPQATQTQVSLKSSEISIFSGEGSLNGLFIGNPQGFKSPSAFELDSIKMALDMDSVTADPIVIKSIVISGPLVTYESGKQGSNLDTIKKNVEAFAGTSAGGEKKQASGSGGPKVIINSLILQDGRVQVLTPFSDKPMGVPLPRIHLKDIGKEKNGASAGEVAQQIFDAINSQVQSAVAAPLKQLQEKFGGAVKGITEKAKSVTEGVTGKAGEVTEGLKGLFKK